MPTSQCESCCASLNLGYDFDSDEPPGFANDFTRGRCADGCRNNNRCRDGAFYDQRNHRDRLGCALGLDFMQTGEALLRDLRVQCDASSGQVSIQSSDGRSLVSESECQTCCGSLSGMSELPNVTFDVGKCQQEGCDSEGTSDCAADDTGCEIGRDFLLLGSVRVSNEVRADCVGGVVQANSNRVRTTEVQQRSVNDCKACCGDIDARFDNGQGAAGDVFDLSSCESGCESSQACVSVLDTSSVVNTLSESNPRSRLGCAMGREMRNGGATILRDLAFQCNTDGSVKATSFDTYASRVLGLVETTATPSASPSIPPTQISASPSILPTQISASPTETPTGAPTLHPTQQTVAPTQEQTAVPTRQTQAPSQEPTTLPSLEPSRASIGPTATPSAPRLSVSPTMNPVVERTVNGTSFPTVSVTDPANAGSGLENTDCSALTLSLGCVPNDLVIIIFFAVLGGVLAFGVLCMLVSLSGGSNTERAAVISVGSVILAVFALASHVLVALELLSTPDDALFLLGTAAMACVALVLVVNMFVLLAVSFITVSNRGLQPWFEDNVGLQALAMVFGIITVESYALLASGACGLTLPLKTGTVYVLRLCGLVNHIFGNVPLIIVTVLASRTTGWTPILFIGLVTSACFLLYGTLFGLTALCHAVRMKSKSKATSKASEVKKQNSAQLSEEPGVFELVEAQSSSALHLDTN